MSGKTVGDLINCYEQAYDSNGIIGMAEVLLDNIRIMDSLKCDTVMQVRILAQQIDCLISANYEASAKVFAETAFESEECMPDLPFLELPKEESDAGV